MLSLLAGDWKCMFIDMLSPTSCVSRRFHWDQVPFHHYIPIDNVDIMAETIPFRPITDFEPSPTGQPINDHPIHEKSVLSSDEDLKDHMDYDRVDKEVAKYTSDVRMHVGKEESDRLLKLIDRRVLVIMILTYFLQAIDKGTLSFASIMGIQEDLGLVGQQVRHYHNPKVWGRL
jgi:hypothetical protein